MGKIVTLRSAVIMGTAVAAGSVAGTVAETLGQLVGEPLPGVGPVVTGAVSLWFAEKLDRLIADDRDAS
ncbi:hypothetical protein Sipo8835_09785 [Streptomyces ipomoeae]|uniref:Holin n=2 Tax=Streptomyces ipomoeae TaxID=103232 RepID=L1KMV4_9ACTN|nr:hypothetical protein [Streptomyces ipomoeae]EKX61874.1 hypothetical protein STRIP9103_01723 [Streptomyces ipomoeae 91-03]MDX2696108.1 hypothetical protein [Streptomyces ipomoeae]MDX2822352.1 hypothetical protein [Streptomyces ipomoeae]MDX2841872.1 hypothetical protein [Streptomyces ipomoeae]MDX2876436.1 hypothetical protein [Streptomyces ipomoeae]